MSMNEPHEEAGSESYDVPSNDSPDVMGHLGQASIDNFGGEMKDRIKLEMACQSSASESLSDNNAKTIAVKHWYCHAVEIFDNGEVTNTTRTVLLTPSGKAFHAVSGGVLKTIALIRKYQGTKVLDPAMVFRIIKSKGKRGQFLSLDFADDVKPANADLK